MKKGQILEGTITEYAFPNKGSMEIEDRKVTIKGAFPGQKVRFSVAKLKKGRAEGRLLEVLEQAPIENTIPACPHFGVCGGCIYQTMSYDNQLKLKEQLVKKLLDGVATDYVWEGIHGSPVTKAYRNKMEFSFGDEYKGGPIALGLHKKGSFHDIVNVTDCCIVDADINEIVKFTRQFYDERRVSFYHKLTHEGVLRHLVVRRSAKSGELLINLVATTQNLEALDLKNYAQGLLALPLIGSIAGILFTKNDSLADAVQSDGTELLYGRDWFFEDILGLKFKITPFSFFQTNTLSAEVLYQAVRAYVGEIADATVFDLYSGTGTIAQLMAPVAKKVIGVEIVEEAVESARVNAKENGLTNCQFIAGDVLKVLDTIEDKPDMIVLDPPRDGIHPKALRKIIDYGVDRIVYVSCKPTSLVRDLEVFLENGYGLDKACAIDQFVNTGHVESIVQLVRKTPDAYIDVTVDMDELDLTASEAKATYQEIKDYILEKHGVKVSSLYVAQIKQKYGIIERDNFNTPKSENVKQPHCPPEKEKLIEEALRHFKMIQ